MAVRGLSEVLDGIHDWGAPSAAGAVIGADSGVLATSGDTRQVFAVASITKLATAYATLLAIEEGSVALGDPLGPAGSTLWHLLCHAGGLDFDSDRVLAAPGTRRIYSNTGYELIAAHLHARTGLTFVDYLTEGVLAPLGMRHSELRGSAAKDLWSTVDDLCRFTSELMRPSLIDTTTFDDARSVQLPELDGVLPGWGVQRPCPWGLGPELRGKKSPHWSGATAPADTFGHFGGSGTFVWVDPVVDVGCVVLTDRSFGEWAVDVWPGFSDRVRALFL